MRPPFALALALALAAGIASPGTAAEPAASTAEATPGLAAAMLHPGWTRPDGSRIAAIELRLEPGWKTYWRSPGEAGIAPSFDWSGSGNLGRVTYHWPVPEVIDSGGIRALGFHDRLLLPVEIAPAEAGQPMPLSVAIEFGLCREICVPATVALTAPPPGPGAAPDAAIESALAAAPEAATATPDCTVEDTADGWRLAARLPAGAMPAAPGDEALPAAVIELASAEGPAPAWVSEAEIARDGDAVTASAEVIPDRPGYRFDPASLRLTLIGGREAVEFRGCAAG